MDRVVCAKALPKSALGINKSWYRMLIFDKSAFKPEDTGSKSLMYRKQELEAILNTNLNIERSSIYFNAVLY
jgi:hypothetical protein